MKTIKFRGKRIDSGEWVYGSLLNNVFVNLVKMKPVTYIIDPSQYEDYDSFEDLEHLAVEVDPETVGQFTGLVDCKGKEIYEGDILIGKSGFECAVSWDELNGCWKAESIKAKRICIMVQCFQDREIIGNMHSNPELLEVKA
jgi:uncharacterized phage protein (TIGR01671 family)